MGVTLVLAGIGLAIMVLGYISAHATRWEQLDRAASQPPESAEGTTYSDPRISVPVAQRSSSGTMALETTKYLGKKTSALPGSTVFVDKATSRRAIREIRRTRGQFSKREAGARVKRDDSGRNAKPTVWSPMKTATSKEITDSVDEMGLRIRGSVRARLRRAHSGRIWRARRGSPRELAGHRHGALWHRGETGITVPLALLGWA